MVSPIEYAPKGLVCFDFDSVLTPIEIIDELAKIAGVEKQVCEITRRAMNGELDYKTALLTRVNLIKGLKVDVLKELGERLPITPGVKETVEYLQRNKILPVIISGGFFEVIFEANRRIGAPLILANRLQAENGVLTGEVSGLCLTPEAKGELLAYLVYLFNIPMSKTAAVCDGANDVSLLRKVALPLGFKPKDNIKSHIRYWSGNDMREILGYLVSENFL
ncbi:MAG: phosphoserine phosphatase SerB [Candidatus Odinarchaeum yellowstonii]|uniref:phosphoserine phosphatase n=1 Tax=Odinarchaeota yellowstonii (strain LCB_4) TaxID=1841599 RepID=A0AAF0IBQ3_ODILC|nr:MAG: phosphoserine phosphatase SerB [Candidatus Odinarchaeum yellowstonii]